MPRAHSYSSSDALSSSYSSYSDSYSSRSRSSSRRGRDRSRSPNRRHRAGGKRSRDGSRDRSRARRGDEDERKRGGHRYPERPPSGVYCHACKRPHHWTIECKVVRDDPSRFPHINVYDGCPICGKVGHEYTRCDSLKFPCKSCGDMHKTRECPYEYKPVEYHEFFDDDKGYPYYFCPSTKATDWVFKGKRELDTLLWHCDVCNVLIKDNVDECVQCHGKRKRRKSLSKKGEEQIGGGGAAGGEEDGGVVKEEQQKQQLDVGGAVEGIEAEGNKEKATEGDKKRRRHREREEEVEVVLTDSYIGSWIDDTKTAAKILEQVADVTAGGGCVQSALSEVMAAPHQQAPTTEGGGSYLTLTAEALRLLE